MIYLLIPLLLLTTALYVLTRPKQPPKGLRDAPSPPGSLLTGNLTQLTSQPHRQFIAWSRQYGEIFRLSMGFNNNWYMLCSPGAVKEIMDKQSAHTSSRSPSPVLQDTLSGGMRFLLMPYGGEWRRLRGVSHKLLTEKMMRVFEPVQDREGIKLVRDILRSGEREGEGKGKGNDEHYMHVRRYTVSVIMTTTYGRRVPEWDCDDVREIYGIMKDFGTVAGTYIADTLPFLSRLPPALQWWRAPVLPLQHRQSRLWMKFWTSLKTQMETGQAPECFVKQFIESDYQSQGITELQAAFLAGSMIEAGSETTSAGINTTLLYLSRPDSKRIRERAFEELMSVVGTSRSPRFEDERSLPFIRAIVKETLRIRPVTNIGTPHYTTADVVYKDIWIPKGSVVAIQQYPIHYNPEWFPEPETYKPERYLGYEGKAGYYAALPDPYGRDHFSFGAGRRICSGLHLAESSMFITIAKILWAFDVLPPVDEEGREVEVDTSDEAFEPGGNTIPKPFKARFVVRSEEIRRTILREWEELRGKGFE